jgi:hypothetical protein
MIAAPSGRQLAFSEEVSVRGGHAFVAQLTRSQQPAGWNDAGHCNFANFQDYKRDTAQSKSP